MNTKRGAVVFLAAVAVILSAAVAGRGALWVVPGAPGMPGRVVGPPQLVAPPPRVTTTQEGALKELRALNRLETASFTADTTVESDNKGNPLQNLLYRDRMLLLARGRVVAGINLASLARDDLSVEGARLTVRLQAPEILSVALDGDATRIYDRTLGFFAKGDKDLETRLRRNAEAAVRQSACRASILDEAARNAVTAVQRMMALAGFDTVTVRVSPPSGTCV